MVHRTIASFLFFCLCLVAELHSAVGQTTLSGKTMGPIEYRVVVNDGKATETKAELLVVVQTRLDKINALMSTYVEDSDVSKFNRSSRNEWVSIDDLTMNVISKSIEISRQTEGAFDITIGPAVEAWDFGAHADWIPPTNSEVEQLKTFVGFQSLELRKSPPAIRKSHDSTRIDLSAIAKGFAVDEISDLLTKRGLTNHLVEIGGEVRVSGKGKHGPWRVGIEKPNEMNRSVGKVVELKNAAMATSGDYRNFIMVKGERYSHTINPATCRPIKNAPASVSVIAVDCMTADALATAIMVLGVEKGEKICQQFSAKMHAYTRTPETKKLREKVSVKFPLADEQPTSGSKGQSSSMVPAFIGTAIIFGIAILGMAVGAIFNQKPISGSCGGIAPGINPDGSSSCTLCSKPVSECTEDTNKSSV